MRVWVRYPWQVAYLPAVLETNPAAAPLKIHEALSACERRRLSPMDEEEQRALAAAEAVLRTKRAEGLDSAADNEDPTPIQSHGARS
jgi:hypothetical protein